MYSKIVHKLNHSISLRLSVLFALLSTGLLVLLSISLFWVMAWQIKHENIKSLNDFSLLIKRDFLSERDIVSLIKNHLNQELSAFHYHHYQVIILDHHKRLVFQSEGFPAPLLNQIKTVTPTNISETPQVKLKTQLDDRHYIASVFYAHFHQDEHHPLTIAVSLNTSQQSLFLDRLRQTLLWFSALGFVLFGLLGSILTRKELAPLIVFSNRIQTISIDNLHHRISQDYWPDEIRVLARTFDDLISRLEIGVKNLSHFSSDLAHELKTPITNLRVQTEVLLDRDRDITEYQATLRNNLEELERLSEMIERLLMLSRLDHNVFKLNATEIALGPLTQKLINYYELWASDKSININLKGDATINADKTLVEMAIGNIISNAIKYTPTFGQVDIEIAPVENAKVSVKVRDNGMGMSDDQLCFIFDRFYRVEASRSQTIPGDGLGLALVKAIMDVHDGAVCVSSQPEVGSTFELLFNQALQH